MHHIDRTFLFVTITLVTAGLFIFSSASLGLLSRSGASFSSVAFSQFMFGIVGGSLALFFTTSIHYRLWRQYAFYIFVIGIILTLAVFIPGLGFEHGGARRWISIGSFSFQPAEIFKIAFVIYVATWLSGVRKQLNTFTSGTLPFLGILAIAGAVLLIQPDTDTYLMMVASALAMFIVAGGRIRDVIIMGLLGCLLLGILAFTRPYILDRILTFTNPELDPQGSGYQIKQSLIAVGSGGLFGRGYGQSIQKFEYLPEPNTDSIFAVFAEEFGFFGACVLVFLFIAFAFRGYRIATHARDSFGMILVVGIVTLIIAQTFLNIAAMVGIMPLSGLPLPFISHGGTALCMTLASVGIILNISRYQRSHALLS